MGYPKNIKPVQRGEPVSASVANRPTNDLATRTDYLKDRMDAAELGNAIFDVDAPLDPTVQQGQAVYWNATRLRYEAALAGAAVDKDSQGYVATPASDCAGLVFLKTSPGVATIVLGGLVPMDSLANCIVGAAAPGRYYLSSTNPGHLSTSRPATTVAVCTVYGPRDVCSDIPMVLVMPQLRDFQADHIHYRYELVCRPAGDSANPPHGHRHTISDPDPTLPGWLPANHSSFNGHAPKDAAFGYNLAAHPSLQRVWPPIPLQAVAVVWDKGRQRVGATEVPQGPGPYGLVICDHYGIWWMSDCHGDVPWPTTATFDDGEMTSLSSSSFSSGSLSSQSAEAIIHDECPRDEIMHLALYFVRLIQGASKAVVTSLMPDTGAPFLFVNCDGNPASTGDLRARLNLTALIATQSALGGLVLKDLAADFQFNQGWVTEGIVAGSSRITLNGSKQRYLTPEDPTTPVVHQGIVVADVAGTPLDVELDPQIVRLQDADEAMYSDVPYIGLLPGRDAELRLRFNLPPKGLPINPALKIRVVLFGQLTGTLPELTMSYARLVRPSADTPTPIPADEHALTFDASLTATAYQAIEVEGELFDVTPGDTILVSIGRAADAGYLGFVGLLRIGGVVVGV